MKFFGFFILTLSGFLRAFVDVSVCDGLYMCGPESDIFKRYGLVGVGVLLWVWAIRPSS